MLVPDYITSSNFEGAWWEVDLGSSYGIARVEVDRYSGPLADFTDFTVTLKEGASPVATYESGLVQQLLIIPESSFKKILVSLLNSFGASRQGRDSLTLTYLHILQNTFGKRLFCHSWSLAAWMLGTWARQSEEMCTLIFTPTTRVLLLA